MWAMISSLAIFVIGPRGVMSSTCRAHDSSEAFLYGHEKGVAIG